jgi:hypothetical protein
MSGRTLRVYLAFGSMRCLLRFSTVKSVLCARFHVNHSVLAASGCELQASSHHTAPARRLEIFLDQQRQEFITCRQLGASIIVTVVPPGEFGVPTSFKFDSSSPPPTPAMILSLLSKSREPRSDALGATAPIAASVNGRVVGLGKIVLKCVAPMSDFRRRRCLGPNVQVCWAALIFAAPVCCRQLLLKSEGDSFL